MKVGLHLLLVVSLAFLASLVARMEYYQGQAFLHQQQADHYTYAIRVRNNITTIEVESALEVAAENADDPRLNDRFRNVMYHRAAAEAYLVAAHHPWQVVHEPPPPRLQHEE